MFNGSSTSVIDQAKEAALPVNEEFNFKSELPSDFAETCTKLEK